MTTIILVAIGILLAAAAALMVVFYGGDAFTGGDAKARASTLLNAGSNVEAAYALYRAQTGGTAAGVADLVSSGSLAQRPALTGIGTAADAWAVTHSNTGSADLVTWSVSGVSDEVCRRVNADMGIGGIPVTQRGRFGCYRPFASPSASFFAVLSGGSDGFNEWRDPSGAFVGMTLPSRIVFGDVTYSRDGGTYIMLQGDGHLCIRSPRNGDWCNGVHDYGAGEMTFSNGLLQLRNTAGTVLWSVGEAGNPGSAVVLLDDGRLQVRAADQRVLWTYR